jgi:hypothetical protein
MFTAINWQADTLLTPARFRQMETQYDSVISYWVTNSFRMLHTQLLRARVLSSAPAHKSGRVYFNSTSNKMLLSTGTNWFELGDDS